VVLVVLVGNERAARTAPAETQQEQRLLLLNTSQQTTEHE
jgi:hypothetical protein